MSADCFFFFFFFFVVESASSLYPFQNTIVQNVVNLEKSILHGYYLCMSSLFYPKCSDPNFESQNPNELYPNNF